MFKEQMNKLKNFFSKNKKADNEEIEEKTDKKKIENLVSFLIILIITIIAINIIVNKDENTTPKEESAYKILANSQTSNDDYTDELEERLEKILGTMTGVGKVNVLITYTQSSEVVAMYNENSTVSHTSESDSSGGTRTVEEQGTIDAMVKALTDATTKVANTGDNIMSVVATSIASLALIAGGFVLVRKNKFN